MTKGERILQLQHAMQTGVALKLNYDPMDSTPKHLRVGVNSAMCETAAIVDLLIKKGVFTLDEFHDVLIKYLEKEVDSYSAEIAGNSGFAVTLL